MRRLKFVLVLLLALSLAAACGAPADSGYRGSLYFAQGSYLMRYGMRDGKLSMVAQFGDRRIREISPLGADRLLVSETASINRVTVNRIAWIDLKTGRSEPLYSGIMARFVADPGVIVYDDGNTLYAVSLSGDSEHDSEILSHRRNQLAAVVPASGDSVLVETVEEGGPLVQAYHAPSGTLRPLRALGDRCRLAGAVWIDDLDLLACRPRDGGGEAEGTPYLLMDLGGNVARRLPLPDGGEFLALAYAAGQGALILRESGRNDFTGQREAALWVHQLASGDNQQISDSLNLGTSVVYSTR